MGPPPRKRVPPIAIKKEPQPEVGPATSPADTSQKQNTCVITSIVTESGERVNVMSMPGMGTLEGAVVDGKEIQFNLHRNFLDGQSQDEHLEEVNPIDAEEELGHAEVILGGHNLEEDHDQEHFRLLNMEDEPVERHVQMDSGFRKPGHQQFSARSETETERTNPNRRIMSVPESLFHNILRQIRKKDQPTLPFSYAGQSFTVQSQKLILNVNHFFKRHKRDPYIIHRLGTPLEQASKILNISSSVIRKIQKRFERLGKVVIPGLKRKKVKPILDNFGADQEAIIRDTIQDFSLRRIPPTVPRLLIEVRDKINFVGSRTSFRRILLRMGFKYAKQNKRTIVVDPNQRQTP